MKRTLTIIVCSIVPFVAMANDSLYADANGDGKITMADVEFIYDYILRTNNVNTSFVQVDINGDGKVNTLDIVEVYVAMRALPSKEDKTIVFVEGVNRESGWYDVNKVGKGDNGDINMCWAASAANIIEWWQDRYVSKGGTLPPDAIKGPGEVYELALMELFHEQWNNEKGGHVVEAVPWYFEGIYYGEHATAGSQAYPLDGCKGAFYRSIWDTIYPHLYHDYSYMFGWYTNLYVGDFNNYDLWGDGSNLLGEDRLRYFTQLVVDFIDRGIASLTVSLSSDLRTLHHATTIWGYEIDNTTNLLTRLWITDSDDLEKEPKKPLLNEYKISIEEGFSHIKLTSDQVRYGSCYAVSLTPVSGYKIP